MTGPLNFTTEHQAIIADALQKRDAQQDPHPVYIQILTSVGGWLAAIAMLAAWGSFFLTDTSTGLAFPGLVGVAAGLYLRFNYAGPFVRQMAAGLIIAGQLGFAIGIGSALDGPIGFFSAALIVTALVLVLERHGYIIPCSFALTLGGLAALLSDLLPALFPATGLDDALFALVCSMTGLGCLFFRTNGLRTDYIGLTSLVALIVYAEYSALKTSTAATLFGESNSGFTMLQLWGGKIVVWAGMIAVAALSGPSRNRAHIALTALGSAVVFALLSFTSAAAFLLLFAGVSLGWRPAAIVGLVAVIWSLGRFYYDLSLSLLDKSLVLVLVGAVLIGAAYLMLKFGPQEQKS